MLKQGDAVLYNGMEGEVCSVIGADMAIVRMLSDNKEYSLPLHDLKLDRSKIVSVAAPREMAGLMAAMLPHIKDMNFLNEMATMMGKHGVHELSIKSGKIHRFEADESLEERKARYRTEAIAQADKKAAEDFAKEHGHPAVK